MTGIVFNIKKYALHDGPGIRTTVFLKGCPLSCKWCHNPESMAFDAELILYKEKCIACKSCDDFTNPEPCPTLALEQVGQVYSAQKLMKEIMKDVVFYDQSHGGVTFSGGEPLSQSDFLLEALKTCKAEGLHTAVDTSGYASWDVFEAIMPYVDLFLYDIKHLDNNAHETMTGVPNREILSNLERLLLSNQVILRVPLVKGYNDNRDMMEQLIQMAQHENVQKISFLPYHNYAENKYLHLVDHRDFEAFSKPEQVFMDWLMARCEAEGIQAQIGG